MQKQIICIICPRGCVMTVKKNNEEITVEGNACKRGKEFAILEMTDPKRSLTSTVKTVFKDCPVLPVRTDYDLPKDLIGKAMEEINKIVVTKKVKMHDIIISDILATGCNIIASCDLSNSLKEGDNNE